MNKLKSFFNTPLISSGTKIQPWIFETPSNNPSPEPPQKTTANSLPKIVIDEPPKALPLKRSQTSHKPPKPAERRKRYSVHIPLSSEKLAEENVNVKVDFEPFEEIVDKRKLGIKKNSEGDTTPSSASPKRGRSSSFSSGDVPALKKNGEPFKKSSFFEPKASSHFDCVPSPTLRSPLNMSKVDENAGLLGDMCESATARKGTLDLLDDSKKKNLQKLINKNENNERNPISAGATIDSLDVDRKLARGTSEGEHLKNNSTENDLGPGALIRNLSDNLSLNLNPKESLKKDLLQGAGSHINEEESGDFTESHLDSLLEENPFHNYKPQFTHAGGTFKRQTTKLRDDPKYKKTKWLLFPDDPWRKRWDWVIVVALAYTALLMPIRVAFITDDLDHGEWTAMDWTTDAIFLLDIFITFFSAYFNYDDNLITNRKKICKNYLTGWFILDVVSIIPFSQFMNTSTQTDHKQQRINNLVRVARIPRLYRLIRIIKLIRMIKVIKDRDKFKAYMNDILKLTPAYERLFVSALGILLFCHIATCLWYVVVSLDDSQQDWLNNNGFDTYLKSEIYVAILYFVVQTVITVGYGDLAPKTTGERLMACFLIIVGVVFYSLFIGFVSSLINDVETMNQRFNHRLHTLYRLQKEYSLPVFFTKKLLNAIKYQNKKTIESKDFINDLPSSLAIELSYVMYREIVHNITFLQNRPKAFIACLCPLLRAIHINKNEIIFREGDPVDEVFFIKSGTIGYVLPQYNNECFLKVREGYFFGEIDLLFYGEIRKYTVQALKDCELYVLSKKDFKHVFLSEHRQIGTALYDNAYLRKQRTRKIYKEAVEICKKRQEDPTEAIEKIRMLHSTIKTLLDKNPCDDDDSDSSDSDDSVVNPLAGIVEQPDEEDDDPNKPRDSVTSLALTEEEKPKSGANFMQLRAAMAFKRKLAPKSTIAEVLGHAHGQRKSTEKGEAKFGELNKKIDGLESKLAKLMHIGNNMKAKSIKDLNALDQTVKSSSSFMLARSPQAGNRNSNVTIEDGLMSPTESALTDRSVLKSPNALRRNMFLKGPKESPNSIFKINFHQMKNLKLASDSPVSNAGTENNESMRFLTPKAQGMTKNGLGGFGGKYNELKSVGTVETEQNLLSETNLLSEQQLTSHRNVETTDRIEEDKEEEKVTEMTVKDSFVVENGGEKDNDCGDDEKAKAKEAMNFFLQKNGRKFKPRKIELLQEDNTEKASKVNVEDL